MFWKKVLPLPSNNKKFRSNLSLEENFVSKMQLFAVLLFSLQWSFNHVSGPRCGLSSTKRTRSRRRSSCGSRVTWSGMWVPWWPVQSPRPSMPGPSGQGHTRLFSIFNWPLFKYEFCLVWCTQAFTQVSRDVFIERHQGRHRQESREQDCDRPEICGEKLFARKILNICVTRSEWGITPRWWTAIWQLSKTTREYLEIKRKFLKISSIIQANITSTKVTINQVNFSNLFSFLFLARVVHSDQHLPLRPPGPGHLQGLFQRPSSLWFPVTSEHLHLLQGLPPQQAGPSHRLRAARDPDRPQASGESGLLRQRRQDQRPARKTRQEKVTDSKVNRV